MPRSDYQPKSFLREIIDDTLSTEGVDPDNAVVAVGKFGERGFAVYPYASQGDPSAKCGVSLVARNVNTGHFNLSRSDAVDIVALLINEYDMDVMVERKTVINVT